MKHKILGCLILSLSLVSSISDARVGGGRSFGSRGSRGFTAPPRSNSPYRSYSAPSPARPVQPSQPQGAFGNSAVRPPSQGSSFLRSMGAGLAGGMIGGLLARSFGGGYGTGGGVGYGAPGGGGGFGILEWILLAGLLFVLYKLFLGKKAETASDGASNLMRQARPNGWDTDQGPSFDNFERDRTQSSGPLLSGDSASISSELALDLFFQIQGAWGNRDLSSVQGILDQDARDYLNQQINQLKAARQINRLENIAVRGSEVVENWREGDKEFSNVHYTANVLDFTVNEDTQQIVEGSKTVPVKFEEYWTYSRDVGSSTWKLSAIQQS